MRKAILSAALAACVVGPVAIAQSKHNSQAPFDFSADQGELQDKAGKGTLVGHVVIKQAEMTLTANRVTLTYTGKVTDGAPEVARVDATGAVTVTRPNQIAKAQYGVYDVSRHTIIMLGGVTLNQGTNIVNGNRLTINLDTNRAVIDGSGVSSGVPGATTKGGRVSGRFSAPKRDNGSK
jgi:lipopolysaccharide export system protein LptA